MSAHEDGAGSTPGSPAAAASPFTREQTRVLEEAHQAVITRAVQEALAAARVDTAAKDAQIDEMRQELRTLSRVRPPREGGEKLGRPPNLDASGKNWEEFSFKFKSHMATQEERGAEALETAEDHSTDTIDYMELSEYMQVTSRQVYYNLTMLCSGASLRIVRSVRRANGLEAYRLLSRRWNPSSKGRHLTKLSQVLHWEFGDASKMLGNLASWESAVEDWENVTQERLGDSVKCAIIAERAPAEVRTHLQLNAPNAKFPQMRSLVEEYLQANAGSTSAPMEVDAIWGNKGKKGKGKGKGKKGKGKGKDKCKDDKGKGKAAEKEEKFEGYCGKCGKRGHKQKVCRSAAVVSEVTPAAAAATPAATTPQLALANTPAQGACGAVLPDDCGWLFMVDESSPDLVVIEPTDADPEREPSAPWSEGVISRSDWEASQELEAVGERSERELQRRFRQLDAQNARRARLERHDEEVRSKTTTSSQLSGTHGASSSPHATPGAASSSQAATQPARQYDDDDDEEFCEDTEEEEQQQQREQRDPRGRPTLHAERNRSVVGAKRPRTRNRPEGPLDLTDDGFLAVPPCVEGLVNHIGEAQRCGRAGETVHITVDSGSIETCCAPTHFPDYPPISCQPKALKTASGATLQHYGRKDVKFQSDEGEEILIRFSVHDVIRPIISVGKTDYMGTKIVLNGDESYIEERATGATRTVNDKKKRTRRLGLVTHFGLYYVKLVVMAVAAGGRGAGAMTWRQHATTGSASVHGRPGWEHDAIVTMDDETMHDELVEGVAPGDRDLAMPHGMRAPNEPTQAERDYHNLTHIPYAEWRRHCVRGRGKDSPHYRLEPIHDPIPNIQMDYFFVKAESDEVLATGLSAAGGGQRLRTRHRGSLQEEGFERRLRDEDAQEVRAQPRLREVPPPVGPRALAGRLGGEDGSGDARCDAAGDS